MRLRLAFKLHGEEADIARSIADAAGIEVDKVAKLAMQRYLRDVLDRAEAMVRDAQHGETNGTDPVHPARTLSDSSDPVSSPAPEQ